MESFWVYILSNKNNTVLHIGVINNIYRRVLEHKEKKHPASFTLKYNVNKLVYYEEFGDIRLAIKREKQLKNWHRDWKDNLIDEKNQTRADLFVDFTIEGL